MNKKYKIFVAIFLIIIIIMGLVIFLKKSSKYPKAKIITSKGTIIIQLFPNKSPKTVANFEKYAKENFYNNLVFHRVIDGFMIQGGGLYANGTVKTTHSPIPLESNNGLSNTRGTIALARTSAPNSATSQFFINTVDNTFLDHTKLSPGYAVFGKVIKGMNVVDKISSSPTTTKYGMKDWPINNIIIKKIIIN